MAIHVINTPEQHQRALQRAHLLMSLLPEAGSPEAEELRVLANSIDEYERIHNPSELPDPIDAIRFRMEEQGLTQRDLIPFFGSRSRVSEVLARKRPLTLAMIQALSTHLGIPAEILIQPSKAEPNFDWNKLPVNEMVRRGWIEPTFVEISAALKSFMNPFFESGGLVLTKTDHIRSARSMDAYSLAAWSARILNLAAREFQHLPPFDWAIDVPDLMKELSHISRQDSGPRAAREFLRDNGIALIVEQHLPQTYLDGAALLLGDRPVIGMTIRHDRLDNFWFCLMHELAHLALHLRPGSTATFFDDLEVNESKDVKEREADGLASEALIPKSEWINSPVSNLHTPQAVRYLANKLQIHEAVVAGRARRESNSYRLFSNMIGYGSVRQNFPEVAWK